MSNTISWNLQLSVKDGRLDDARTLMTDMVASVEKEAGTLGYEWFLSADGKVCHIIERYADSGAVTVHLGNFMANFGKSFMDCFKATSLVVYGDPSKEARAGLDGLGASYLGWLGGFTR